MQVRVLGAHELESRDSRCISLLVDGVLAIDAGSLTSGLSFSEQERLKAIILTHQHYDHIRDIPAIGINFMLLRSSLDIYSTQTVCDVLLSHLVNETIYPDFTKSPPDKPSLRLNVIEPGLTWQVAGYSVLPVSMNHTVPAVGFQVTSKDGKSLFYSSDTGPGLAECWRKISPQLLFIEATAPDKYEDFALRSRHLTPNLLKRELESFRDTKGYLPRIVLVHINPMEEKEIKAEIAGVAGSLGVNIELGYEGMTIDL